MILIIIEIDVVFNIESKTVTNVNRSTETPSINCNFSISFQQCFRAVTQLEILYFKYN